MVNKKTIWFVAITLVLVALLFWVLFFKVSGDSFKYPIELTEDKLITNQTLINMIVQDMKSPLGNNLTKSVIDEANPEIMDDGWKYAYYTCSNGEHSGWIYVAEGDLKVKLYGPYGWCYV